MKNRWWYIAVFVIVFTATMLFTPLGRKIPLRHGWPRALSRTIVEDHATSGRPEISDSHTVISLAPGDSVRTETGATFTCQPSFGLDGCEMTASTTVPGTIVNPPAVTIAVSKTQVRSVFTFDSLVMAALAALLIGLVLGSWIQNDEHVYDNGYNDGRDDVLNDLESRRPINRAVLKG